MTLNIEVLPRIPSQVYGQDGVTVAKSNGALTIGFDYENSGLGAELQQAIDTTNVQAAAAEASNQAASDYADAAASSASDAADSAAVSAANGASLYPTTDDTVAATVNTSATYFQTHGLDALGPGGALLKKVSSDEDFTTANSVKLQVIPKDPGASLSLNSLVAADGSEDATAALNKLVATCKEYGVKKIHWAGKFRFDSAPDPFDVGIQLIGHGNRSNYFIRNFDQGTGSFDAAYADPFLHWSGTNADAAASKGGGFLNGMIYAAANTVGGVAIMVTATDLSLRPGYECFSDLAISADNDAEWGAGIVLDGVTVDDGASGGHRDGAFRNVDVFTSRYVNVFMRSVRHMSFHRLSLNPSFGDGILLQVTGGSTDGTATYDVHFSDLICYGTVSLINSRRCKLSGYANAVTTSGVSDCTWHGPLNSTPNNQNGITFYLQDRIVWPVGKTSRQTIGGGSNATTGGTAVSFGITFASTPTVTAVPNGDPQAIGISSITTTGFTAKAASSTVNIQWHATGVLPLETT